MLFLGVMEEVITVGGETLKTLLKENEFWLNCAHFTFAMMGIRKKFGKNAAQQPMASFILSYLSCFLRY